jgi:citrate lyase beta subunit
MTETKEGLANLDAICATPGLDAVYIGPADLSYALGLPTRGDNPDPVIWPLRPHPRDGAPPRHQGVHALRERGVHRRGGEAWLRPHHAHVGPIPCRAQEASTSGIM